MIKFKTESGSVYTIDGDRWETTSASTRTKAGGGIVSHSEVVVGASVLIVAPGLVAGTRLISTSPVVEILENTNA